MPKNNLSELLNENNEKNFVCEESFNDSFEN